MRWRMHEGEPPHGEDCVFVDGGKGLIVDDEKHMVGLPQLGAAWDSRSDRADFSVRNYTNSEKTA